MAAEPAGDGTVAPGAAAPWPVEGDAVTAGAATGWPDDEGNVEADEPPPVAAGLEADSPGVPPWAWGEAAVAMDAAADVPP
ncbi:hypothetical protein [Aquisphaera giovannonii]|uniref:hypothetical protein n=1 Tax=Aquisphaera giovannonii TaxID=406548 RepID=UPI0011DFDD67|nr:hypothetical protein [Aquisphaera giovannonii]